jgi:hypothetical protein
VTWLLVVLAPPVPIRGSPDADEANVVTPNNFESHLAAQNSSVDYIPVQRLVQSIKQVAWQPGRLIIGP